MQVSLRLRIILLFLPLTAWFLAINLWQAFWLDLAFMLFYLVYGYFYHWGYLLFPNKKNYTPGVNALAVFEPEVWTTSQFCLRLQWA